MNNTDLLIVKRGAKHYKKQYSDFASEFLDDYRNDISIINSGYGTFNTNPMFVEGDKEYENYVPASNRNIADDVVYTTGHSLEVRGSGSTLRGSFYLPFDSEKEVRGSIIAKPVYDNAQAGKTYTMRFYLGIMCYDSDFNFIEHSDVYRKSGTETTLYADLNNGDTTMKVVDASQWYNGNTHHRRDTRVLRAQDGGFHYTGASGRIYNDEGMSKWGQFYVKDGLTDNGTHWEIQLENPWADGSFQAGDRVRNAWSGGSYQYWLNGDLPVNEGWQKIEGAWLFKPYSDVSSATGVYRDGTAYIKLLGLLNYRLMEDGSVISKAGLTCNYGKLALEWRHKT